MNDALLSTAARLLRREAQDKQFRDAEFIPDEKLWMWRSSCHYDAHNEMLDIAKQLEDRAEMDVAKRLAARGRE